MRAKIVVKLGGSLLDPERFPKLVKALSPKLKSGAAVVVHGGGKEITKMASALAIPTRFVDGRRFTDDKLMEVVEMVLAGKVNAQVTEWLRKAGVNALGLSGRSCHLLQARALKELGRVGLPQKVNVKFLEMLWENKIVPVLSSIGESTAGAALNINADEMASAIAAKTRAQTLVLFTDVPGILDAEKKTIPVLTPALAQKLIRDQVITGGMIPKVRSALNALRAGVGRLWILEGALPLALARGTFIGAKAPLASEKIF